MSCSFANGSRSASRAGEKVVGEEARASHAWKYWKAVGKSSQPSSYLI